MTEGFALRVFYAAHKELVWKLVFWGEMCRRDAFELGFTKDKKDDVSMREYGKVYSEVWSKLVTHGLGEGVPYSQFKKLLGVAVEDD